MKGKEAFDWLVENHYMEVNQVGIGWITKAPKKGDLDMFVKCVVKLGAHSVTTAYSDGSIEVTCGCNADDLRFQKRWPKKTQMKSR